MPAYINITDWTQQQRKDSRKKGGALFERGTCRAGILLSEDGILTEMEIGCSRMKVGSGWLLYVGDPHYG